MIYLLAAVSVVLSYIHWAIYGPNRTKVGAAGRSRPSAVLDSYLAGVSAGVSWCTVFTAAFYYFLS